LACCQAETALIFCPSSLFYHLTKDHRVSPLPCVLLQTPTHFLYDGSLHSFRVPLYKSRAFVRFLSSSRCLFFSFIPPYKPPCRSEYGAPDPFFFAFSIPSVPAGRVWALADCALTRRKQARTHAHIASPRNVGFGMRQFSLLRDSSLSYACERREVVRSIRRAFNSQ